MKFRSERDALLEVLATASRATSTRGGALPVLSGIRLEVRGNSLHAAGTDLDLTIETRADASGLEDGACVVPARLATDIVRALEPGAVTLSVDGTEATITAGRSAFTVRTLPVEEFLRLPEPPEHSVTIEAGDLVVGLNQVVRASSRDDARPILTGVLLATEGDGLRMVATDSYRLAMRDLPGNSPLAQDQKVLVPGRALAELARVLGDAQQVLLRLGTDQVAFEVGPTRLTTRLIEGEFPDYRQLLPSDYPNRLTIGKEPLLDAIRRVKLLAREGATPVRLHLSGDGLALEAVTQDVGQAREEIDAKYEGTELTVAFNPEFLVEGVEATTGDEVVLETVDALKPATIRPTDGTAFLYLLMPVRVS